MEQFLLIFLILFPMAAAFLVQPLRNRSRRGRNLWIQIVPAAELLGAPCLLFVPGASVTLPQVCGMGLTLEVGSLQTLLALAAAFLWCATGLASPAYFASAEGCSRYYFFWLLTQGALMGVFLAGDLFTLFVFFEMMSMASYVWVAQNETPEALRAGETYLAVAVIGGMVLLAGILLLQHLLGTLVLDQLAGAAAALPPEKRGAFTPPAAAAWWVSAPRQACIPCTSGFPRRILRRRHRLRRCCPVS